LKYFYKNLSIWLIIALIAFLAFSLLKGPSEVYHTIAYNDFLDKVDNGILSAVTIKDNTVSWSTADNTSYQTIIPKESVALDHLLKKGVRIQVKEEMKPHWFLTTFLSWVPILLLILVWFFFMRGSGQGGGGGKAMAFGKSRAQLVDPEQSKVRLDDVAGVDEAKEEVSEIVDFLKEPERFTEAGARIPTGVLLYGEPGTRSTLLFNQRFQFC